VPTPRDPDEPYEIDVPEHDRPPRTMLAPARFHAMTPEQRWDWPNRAFRRGLPSRLLLLAALTSCALIPGVVFRFPAPIVVNLVGLAFDITGVLIMAEAILVSDADVAFLRTWDGEDAGDLFRRLDARQGWLGTVIVVVGFVLQVVSAALSVALRSP
jgi:hypothetical protein